MWYVYFLLSDHHSTLTLNVIGPPGQMVSVCGKKDGMKQGELGGILKELGYSQDQVFKF